MMKLLFSVAGLIGFVILSVEFLILCWVILLFIWNTIYPPPSHFQLSGRAGTGTWKKSSGRVLGSWLCFRQCFEETSYSSLLHHNFALISSCYLFCCPANVSWLIGVTLFVSGSRDNWSPDASLAALIAHRTFVTKLVSHFATTIDHNNSAKQGYVDGIFF